jgi:hypothetical protein
VLQNTYKSYGKILCMHRKFPANKIGYKIDIYDLSKAKTKAEKVYGMTAEKGYDRKKEDWSL